MSRIRKAFAAGFHQLLGQARARQPERGVRRLFDLADELHRGQHIPINEALLRVHGRVSAQPFFVRQRAAATPARFFFCDCGLGGLARWLRACGYQALWEPRVDDSELLRRARTLGATVLTTDSVLLERRVVRDGIVRTLWLPPMLPIARQLQLVSREFRLEVGEPRCMSCGGELVHGDKEELRERIPPRTYKWLDEYFVCRSCGKLFWHGTHWERIQKQLQRTREETEGSG